MVRVLVYPTANSSNPYQKLLYEDLKGFEVKYLFSENIKGISIKELLQFPWLLVYWRFKGVKIFHLHWPIFSFAPDRWYWLFWSTLNSFFSVGLIKLLGYRLVWSVHNVVPHEKQTLCDWLFSKWIVLMSDKVITHNESVKKIFIDCGFSSQKIKVIPIMNYISEYDSDLSRDDARSKLSLKKNRRIFLYFGMIRKYKGVNELISSAKKILKTHQSEDRPQFVFVGACIEKSIRDDLFRLEKEFPEDVTLLIRHVSDEDLSRYIIAADVIVLPFNRITTSASLITACGFGRPIIFPALNNLSDIPNNVGFRYIPPDGLTIALVEALKYTHLDNKGRNAKAYAEQFKPEIVCNLTREVFLSII